LARTWLQVEVVLAGAAEDERRDPGRVFLVGPKHTFGQLADAINAAFARWDLSHLHEFRLADGRLIGFPDDEFAPEVVWEDQAAVRVADASIRAISSSFALTSAPAGAIAAACWPTRPIRARTTGRVGCRRARWRSGDGGGSPTSTGARPPPTATSSRSQGAVSMR
jgi:hypothetical protein